MSILLEALRKSEKSQRAHEAPTIHADDEVTTVPESLATGPLAMLLVSALFASGWFVWHQYQAPAPVPQPTVAGTGELVIDTAEANVGGQAVVADTAKSSATDTSQAAPARKRPAEVGQPPRVSGDTVAAQLKTSSTVTDKSVAKQRTPVESYKAPASGPSKTKSDSTDRPAVTAAPTRAMATQAPAKKAEKPVETTRPKPPPETPRPIGYWELPDSVRAKVPEIKFNVLVYAKNPSDRFVLINGERLVEGDKAGPELVVREIRRDGVIFRFRSYKFLVER